MISNKNYPSYVKALNPMLSCDSEFLSVYVEGKNDFNVFHPFFNSGKVAIIPAARGYNKKHQVQDIIDDSVKRKRRNVFGIIDIDFDYFLKSNFKFRPNKYLAYTDSYDLDTQIFFSSAFRKMLKKKFEMKNPEDPEKPEITILSDETLKEIIKNLKKFACELGKIRLACKKAQFDSRQIERENNIRLIPEIFDYKNNKFEILKLKEFSYEIDLDNDKYERIINIHRNLNYNDDEIEFLINGHDIYQIFCLLLKNKALKIKYKNLNPKFLNNALLETDARSFYSWIYFTKSNLYGTIREWERENKKTLLKYR